MSAAPKFDLIEPGTSPGSAPAPQFDLVEPGKGGPQFDIIEPQTLDQLNSKFGNLNYEPTDDEILRYKGLKKGQLAADVVRYQLDPTFRINKSAELTGEALKGGWEFAKETAKGLAQATLLPPGMQYQSVAEGVARGLRNSGLQIEQLGQYAPAGDPFTETPTETAEDQQRRVVRDFRQTRKEQRQSADLASGKETLLPQILGPTLPAIAEMTSLVADPTMYLPLGLGAEAKGASIARDIVGRSLRATGRGTEALADKAITGIKALQSIPAKVAEAIVGAGTEEAAQLAPTIGKYGQLAAVGGAGALGVASPATLGTIAAIGASAPVAKVAGQALSAAGRNLLEPSFSAQLGLLGNMARDPAAAQWVRGAARFAQPLDPLLSAAGRGVEGAIHGAPVAGLMTAALGGDEDQVAQSMGAGAVLGAGGRIAAGIGPAARRTAVESDLVRWKSGMTPETIATLDKALPDPNQQAKVMNAQRFISGVGDVDFHYLTADQWKEAGLAPGRALETTPGDRPQVYVNATEIGNGAPVIHEIGHVLHRLFPDEAADLHRTLFSDFHIPDGPGTDFTSGRTDTSSGILSPEQQQKLYDSYFTKLDPKIQAERRATWNRSDHLRSAREEIVGELLSNLLIGKEPDYLHKLSGPLRRVADSIELNATGRFLNKIPGLDRLGERTLPGGSSLLTLDGEPLRLNRKEAAALRGLLRARDRTTRELRVGEDARPIGAVSEAEMRGKHHEVISRLYGNSDTYAKNPDGSIRLAPDGRPVLLTEAEVRKLNANRYDAIGKALTQVPQGSDTLVVNGREIKPMRLLENGRSWEGDYFSDAQLKGIKETVPGNLITPEQLSNIARLNEAIKTGEGTRLGVDHNTATKEIRGSGRRKYASQGSKFYELVPYGFGVNKEGGLYFRAFDAGNLDRKLGRWMEGKPTSNQFSVWGNDRRAVEADIYKYLDNQRNGVPNSIGLDADPVRAVQKRNLISDLLGATRGLPEVNPSQLSTKSGRDNHFKSFRIDRVNKLTESGGKDLPVDYGKAKQNLMPPASDATSGALPPGVTPGAVMKHTEAQAMNDLKAKLVSGGAPAGLADQIAADAWTQAQKAARRQPAPSDRAYTLRAAERLNQLGPADIQAVRAATIKGGTDGAAKEIEKRLLVARIQGQRIPVRVK